MVNLVVPCSLIAMMVLLSFILPPESGERIGLGITVLMAMAIFQELTSNKLPADSQYIPLLGNVFRELSASKTTLLCIYRYIRDSLTGSANRRGRGLRCCCQSFASC